MMFMFDSTLSLDHAVVVLNDRFYCKDYIYALFSNCFVSAREFRNKLKFNARYVLYCELHISCLEVVINKDDMLHCLLCMGLFNSSCMLWLLKK